MIQLTIDDKPILIAEGRSLLDACREHGFYVPTLCYHPALEPYGACRLCVVEITQGNRLPRLVAACAYPCENDLVVWTNNEAVQHNRRITAELLLASAYDTPEVEAIAAELGVKDTRYKMLESDACVLCGLCVRACKEIVGVNAISLINRGIDKKVSPPFEIASSSCISCVTCILICPTGRLKLSDVTGFRSVHQAASEYYRLYCQVCSDVEISLNV